MVLTRGCHLKLIAPHILVEGLFLYYLNLKQVC